VRLVGLGLDGDLAAQPHSHICLRPRRSLLIMRCTASWPPGRLQIIPSRPRQAGAKPAHAPSQSTQVPGDHGRRCSPYAWVIAIQGKYTHELNKGVVAGIAASITGILPTLTITVSATGIDSYGSLTADWTEGRERLSFGYLLLLALVADRSQV